MRGDISNPDVWRRVAALDLETKHGFHSCRQWPRQSADRTVVNKDPQSHVFARSNGDSRCQFCGHRERHNAFSINGLLEDMIPVRWTR